MTWSQARLEVSIASTTSELCWPDIVNDVRYDVSRRRVIRRHLSSPVSSDVDSDVMVSVINWQVKQTDAEDAERTEDDVHCQTQTKCHVHLKFNKRTLLVLDARRRLVFGDARFCGCQQYYYEKMVITK